jgi:hypothetical protein
VAACAFLSEQFVAKTAAQALATRCRQIAALVG